MGRQKTLWIDEECWAKLEQMEGDSVSSKVRRAIKMVDRTDDAVEMALRKQIERLEGILKSVGWKG
jgi:hypothetical protein